MISGDWNPLAFFLDQSFCDISTIRNAVRSLALRYKSRRAVLVVIRKKQIQRSLTIVFDEDSETADEIEQRLYHIINHQLFTSARLIGLDRQLINCQVGELFQEGAEDTDVLHSLAAELRPSGRVRTASCRELCFAEAKNEDLDAFVIFFDCDDSAFNPADFYSLSTMIAASVTVMVQDQVELVNLHRRTVSVPVSASHFANNKYGPEDPSQQYDKVMADIIERFRALISADAVILMHQQRKNGTNNTWNWQQYAPVAVVRKDTRIDANNLTRLANCRSIEFASRKNRSLLFSRNTNESTDMRFQYSVGDIEACVNQKIDSILITPMGSTEYQFILVTIRTCKEGESQSFSANDLGASFETIRSVFARHRVAKSGIAFLELEKMLASPYSATDLPVLASNMRSGVGPSEPQARIPLDLSMAYHDIQELLKIASDATGSHSATFRLVSSCNRSLVRTVSALDETNNHPNSDIDLNSMAITAVVAREGVAIYEPNITRLLRKDLQPIEIPQRSSRAEFCLPVFLSGMLIGVLNFEHRVDHAYDEWEHLLELVAVSVGQQLALSRRAIDNQFLSSIPSIFDLEHMRNHTAEFLAFLYRSEANFQSCTSEFVQELFSKAKALDTEIKGSMPYENQSPRIKGLAYTIERVLKNSDYAIDLVRESQPSRRGIELDKIFVSEITTRALEIAGNNISRNLTDHSFWGEVVLKHDVVKIGGRDVFELVITSPAREQADDFDIARFNRTVYRLPYRQNDQGRMHYGCYIAGRALREIGGDIHGQFYDDGITCSFQSKLYIPIESNSETS